MIEVQKVANMEVGQLTMSQGQTMANISLKRKFKKKEPVIQVQIISHQKLKYSLIKSDQIDIDFELRLEDGKRFDAEDKVNYFVVYL